jgi:hypothetical protein
MDEILKFYEAHILAITAIVFLLSIVGWAYALLHYGQSLSGPTIEPSFRQFTQTYGFEFNAVNTWNYLPELKKIKRNYKLPKDDRQMAKSLIRFIRRHKPSKYTGSRPKKQLAENQGS